MSAKRAPVLIAKHPGTESLFGLGRMLDARLGTNSLDGTWTNFRPGRVLVPSNLVEFWTVCVWSGLWTV